MYINHQDAQNSMIRLYFPLHALYVSDYISGTTFISCTSHLVYTGTKCDVQPIKVAPEDGLI